VALRGKFSGPVSPTDPAKSSKDSASLAVCTRKEIFWLGGADFLWKFLSYFRQMKKVTVPHHHYTKCNFGNLCKQKVFIVPSV